MPRGKPSPKLAITIDPEVHERLIAAVGREGLSLSAWMTNAVREALWRREGLEAVAEWETQNGPFREKEMAEARERVEAQMQRAPAKVRRSA